jgi:hypothetical protein
MGVQEPIGHKHLAIGHHIELIVPAPEICPQYPAPSKLIPDAKDGVGAPEVLSCLKRELLPPGCLLQLEEPAQLPDDLSDLFLGVSMEWSKVDDDLLADLAIRGTIGLHQVERLVGAAFLFSGGDPEVHGDTTLQPTPMSSEMCMLTRFFTIYWRHYQASDFGRLTI